MNYYDYDPALEPYPEEETKPVDAEQELDQLREQMLRAKSELVNIITGEVEDPTLQTLLILRYVSVKQRRQWAWKT